MNNNDFDNRSNQSEDEKREGSYYRPYEEPSGGNGGGYSYGYVPLNLPPENTGLATASMVIGIIGIFLSCCCGIGILFGILGLVLALIDRSHFGRFSGVALGGLICAIIATVLSIGMIIVSFATLAPITDLILSLTDSLMESMSEAGIEIPV